jgi:hypothetical protein
VVRLKRVTLVTTTAAGQTLAVLGPAMFAEGAGVKAGRIYGFWRYDLRAGFF